MNQSRIIKSLFLALGIISLQACDNDYNNIGGDVIGDGSLQIDTYNVEDIVAYNQEYGAMDTKNLVETPLGALRSDVFGETSSSIITQISYDQATLGTIGENATIDSVYVYVPYFSKYDKTEDKIQYYKLDNVYGKGTFDLQVYQNGYYLNSANVETGDSKKYFSNDGVFDANIKSPQLNTGASSQNTSFTFNNTNIIIPELDEDGNIVYDEETSKPKAKETLSPGMWLDLDKDYFQQEWFDNKEVLKDPTSFKDLFRGLYFRASASSNQNSTGSIGLLNFPKGKFVIKYTYDDKTKDKEGEEVVTRKKKTISLSFISPGASGNLGMNSNINVNLFRANKSASYEDALRNSNKVTGDEKLFVKGTEGSLAVVSLFQKDDGKELQELRDKNIMVNDAILTVYVDKELMSNQDTPPRLQLYNYDNESFISDFVMDQTTVGDIQKPYYGGIFEKEDTENNKAGYVYRIRLTQHIVNLIKNKNVKNHKLAIVVANEYNSGLMSFMSFRELQSLIPNSPKDITLVNPFTVSCPVGTVLHGSAGDNINTRMKLDIFYTKK